MIDVHSAIGFDCTLCQLWDEPPIGTRVDDIVKLEEPIEGAIVVGEAEIVDIFPYGAR
ncbi:MAG TPA: hypothetical protein VFP84_24550 [Kofleriaceae bacterium]|nr:hypothetical protein [Kofleriaceae bacterium]